MKMSKEKLKDICTVFLCAGMILVLAVINIVKPQETLSLAERRYLNQRPALSFETVLNGKYMSEFELSAMDQFPARDRMRELRSIYVRNVLWQGNNHGYYLEDGYLAKIEYPLNEKNWSRSINVLRNVYNEYLKNSDCRLYYSMIPDINMFTAVTNGCPSLDYKELGKSSSDDLSFAEYIDLTEEIRLQDFFATDPHWKQEEILHVAEKITSQMGAETFTDLVKNTANEAYYGTYYSQAAVRIPPDTLFYMTNECLENCTVTAYDSGRTTVVPMYDLNKATGRDPYELFLSGAHAIATITNPGAETDRKLVIFRDSYGSSIAPLLVSSYSEVTLVDLRYVGSSRLGEYMDFTDQDVLFLYSTMLLNTGVIF